MESRSTALLGLSIALALSSQLTPAAQQTDAGRQADQKIVLGTSEVVLDVVVRDKKGHPAKDLAASDFEVYEDGVRQQIQSFRLHQREHNAASSTAGGGAEASRPRGSSANPPGSANYIALVFDHLSAGARELARKSALKYVSETLGPGDYTGVFAVDLSLRTLQGFTSDGQRVRKAIDRLSSLNTSGFIAGADPTAGGPPAPPGAPGPSGAGPDATAARISANIDRAFSDMEQGQQGFSEMHSLLAIVDSFRSLAGRKAVVLFSEGLALNGGAASNVDTRLELFRRVISSANRLNVTFYTIDAAGLRVISPRAATRNGLNSVAGSRADQVAGGLEGNSLGTPMTFDLENNEDLLRMNPQAGLAQLANQTGGFLIADTNDPSRGLARVDEEVRNYYILTYVPANNNYDGRFRKISVKLDRPGLDVETRKGYVAIRPMPVLDWERDALDVLASGETKDAFQIGVKAFSFPDSGRPGLVSVLVEAPARAFTYNLDNEKHVYTADFTIVSVVRDISDQIVNKLGQHYQVTGPAAKLEAARRGEILFYREAELQPGLYSVEAIAFDTPGGKAATLTDRVEVPPAGSAKLRLSSIAVLRRAERLSAADKKEDNPFHFGETLIYPNMGEPLSQSRNKQIAVFFDVYPAKDVPAPPKLTITVLKNDKPVLQVSADLPAPDAQGRIQFIRTLSLDRLQPGDYILKTNAADGVTSVSRSTRFTVRP
ncbi:MAG TPA: VWA domain-containing protein [Blastocatellia bacterium]|nr:VWA domain-containing protein [Blastocatellia bacterium]